MAVLDRKSGGLEDRTQTNYVLGGDHLAFSEM